MAGVDTILYYLDIVIFILKWFWWLILAFCLFIMKLKYKKWPVEAVIIEKRGNNLVKTNDRAGRYVDPYTGITGYRLQKSKDTIPVIGYDWVLHNVYLPTTLPEKLVSFLRGNIGTIFLFRYGSRQYKPIRINDASGKVKIVYQPIKNKDGEETFIQVYQAIDPRDKMGALDFEVVDWDNMNFMVQEQRASIIRREKKGEWIKTIAIPLAIIGATVIFSIIMIKFGYDYAISLKSTTPTETKATPPSIPVISSALPGS